MLIRICLICACSFSFFSTCLFAGGGLIIISTQRLDGDVSGLSANGSVAAGSVVTQKYDDDQPFIWNITDGVSMIDLPGSATYAQAYSISDDGLRIFGEGDGRYFTWTKATGTQQTTALSHITALSDDGLVFVGGERFPTPSDPQQASKSSGGITTTLGILPTTDAIRFSVAWGVSADGSVIVGESTSDLTPSSYATEAFIWTAESGLTGLGLEVDSVAQAESSAKIVSPAGDIIVGTSSGYSGDIPVWRVFRWTAETGMVSILSENYTIDVNGMSADGSVIVGTGLDYNNGNIIPWIWTEGIGKQTLFEWLGDAGVDTGTWDAGQIYAVSADGKTVGGSVTIKSEGSSSTRPFVAWVSDFEPLPEIIFGGRGGSMEDPLIP